MRIRTILVSILVLGAWAVFSTNRVVAQEVFNDYITHPDVWRPAKIVEPGVDAQGDLNLSIPVLTVPGRGGLDYDVRFSYRSGITLKQQSSWIGLGWSFDPGSITRDVHGIIKPDGQGNPVPSNVDYTDVPDEQPDMYYVTLPGGGFTMVRRQSSAGLKPPRGGSDDFYLNEWQPWKVATDVTSPAVVVDGYETRVEDDQGVTQKADYGKFTLTAPDGTRYLFEEKTLATYEGLHPFVQSVETYVNTWRLTAILGPDYSGTTPPSPGSDPGGSWVRFEYHDVDTGKQSTIEQYILQSVRLQKIITPTHEAVFESTAYFRDIPDDPYNSPKVTHYRLDAIKLNELHGSGQTLIREVKLEHIANGHGGLNPRLRFDSILFYGEGGASTGKQLPGYAFTYYGTDGNAPVNENNTDDFGYYNDGDSGQPGGGKSWSLESITHPTGGIDVISYENDGVSLPIDGGGNPGNYDIGYDTIDDTPPDGGPGVGAYTFSTINDWQGGARVTQIERYEIASSSTPLATTTYTYGNSRVSGVPSLHWERIYGPGASNDFFMPSGRGRPAVVYEEITARYDDGTFSTTYYTTDLTDPSIEVLDAVLYKYNASVTVVQGNQDINWGLPYKTVSSTGRSEKGLALGAVKLASAIERGTIEADIGWRLGNTVHYEERAAYRGGNLGNVGEVLARIDYTYDYGTSQDDATGFIRTIKETGYGLTTSRVTERTYAYEAYSTLDSENILSPVIREDVAEDNGGSLTYHRSQVTTWASFNGIYHPSEVFQWEADQPGARPSFTAWSGGSPGGSWQRQVTYDTYDAYGHVLQQTDARGTVIEFFYGDNTSPLSPSSYFNHALLTGIRINGSAGLTSTMNYDEEGRLTDVFDPNNQKRTFTYDEFGRLVDTKNDAGGVVAHNEYHLSRCNATNTDCDNAYDLNDPNYVRTSLDTGSNTYVTTEYIDAYGRTIQTQQQDGSDDIISTILYDALGREQYLYKPHVYNNSSHGYVGALSSIIAASNYYDGNPGPDAFGHPYTENVYDSRGRLGQRYLPAIESNRDFQAFNYWNDAQSTTTGDTVAVDIAADEEGNATLTFSNALGQNFLTRQFVEKDPEPGVPANITLSASHQTGNPELNIEQLDWDYDSETFTVPETQIVFYSIDLEVTGVGAASVTFYENSGYVRKISFNTTPGSNNHYEGFFIAYPGNSYEVEAAAGTPIPGGSDGLAEVNATFTFQTNGKVTVLNTTGFDYDVVDNLLTVRPPNYYNPPSGSNASDWVTSYEYNTLGQLTEKTTPDTDSSTEYAYDAGGNPRFVNDPNHTTRTGSGFLYSKYDAYSRLIETGVYTGSTSFSTAASTYADQDWPTGTDREEVVEYVFDDYAIDCTRYTDHGFTCLQGLAGSSTDNPKGNVTQVISDEAYYHYFYDDEGRLAEFYVFLKDLGGKLTRYEYDLQGKVEKVIYQEGEADALYHWYAYDNLGRLVSVKTNTEDNAGSAVDEALYSYTATGQVELLELGTDPNANPAAPLLFVDYQYNSRDWLTQINDPANLGADKFAMRLGYNTAVVGSGSTYKNGNVGSLEWSTEGNNNVASRVGYTFAYDRLSRLTSADFQYYSSGWVNSDAAAGTYDVGVSTPIDYDYNGNIVALRRYKPGPPGQNPVEDVISYDYEHAQSGFSNRLQQVTIGGTPYPFIYDPNGSMTQSRVATGIDHDRRNLPTTLTVGGDALYFRYDPDGQRVYKQVMNGGGSTQTFYVRGAGGEVMAVYVDDGGGPRLTYWNILSGGAVVGRINLSVEPPGGS